MLTTLTKDDWIRGSLYALAMGMPLLLGQLLAKEVLAFVALGAMFTLRIDPRTNPKHQTIAMVGGMSLMILSGVLGSLLVGHRELAILILIIISFLAGQPGPHQSYLSLLGKLVIAALLLGEIGFPATLDTALAYFSGALLALLLSLMQARLFPSAADIWSPAAEWRELRSGEFNGALFGIALPLTILAAILSANWLHVQHEVWVGLTVLFVMHVDDTSAWKKVWQRVLGTLLGVVGTYVALTYLPVWSFPWLVMLAALFIPSNLRQSYLIFSCLITMVILLVIDLAMQSKGGDKFLIQWRLIDTTIGCAWVMVSLIVMKLGKKFWSPPSH